MPDVHLGIGATVGSVVPTLGAIIPAAVGVDIGCGMMALKTDLSARDLPDDLHAAAHRDRERRAARADRQRRPERPGRLGRRRPNAVARGVGAARRRGSRRSSRSTRRWTARRTTSRTSATLGTGNHFIEVCLDEEDAVWLMLHSGSRGIGNKIGTYFIELAKEDMRRSLHQPAGRRPRLPARGDGALRRLRPGRSAGRRSTRVTNRRPDDGERRRRAPHAAGAPAVHGADRRRELPPQLRREGAPLRQATSSSRGRGRCARGKGRPRRRSPAAWGPARYIVRGLGNPESFDSCSHGAGRSMSRAEARRRFTRRRPRRGDGRGRVPQGRGRHRRDAGGLQVDRRGHGGAEGPRRGRSTRSTRSSA